MASTVTWRLNLKEVEIGKTVEFSAEGLDSFELMAVLIQKPDGSHFVWGVQADANGRVRDTISLDSGLGQYLFCPRPACGNVVPHCHHLNVCPCGVSKTNCNITVEGPSQIVKGTAISYVVRNLKPSRLVTTKVSNNQQVSYDIVGVASVMGEYIFVLDHNLAGTYSLTFSDGDCTSAPKIVEIINSQNEIPILRPDNKNPCADGIDITLKFNKSSYAPSERGNILVSICNRGPEFRQVSLAPSLVLPGATVTSMPVLPTIGLPGYKCEEMVILFTTGTADAAYTANLYGSYLCGGLPYTANGGSANAIVGKGLGVCSALLQYFGTVSGSQTASVNEEVELALDVYNSGNKIIDSVSLTKLVLPAGVTVVTPLPVTAAFFAPGAAVKLKVKVKAAAAGTYTISLAADSIKYKCGGADVFLTSPGFVTLTVA